MIKAAQHLIFPDQCPLCRALLAGNDGLCGRCWRDTPFILGLVCDLCGAPQIGQDNGVPVHCDACRALARPWNRGRAVMSYSGNGRRLVLALKHGDRLDLAPTFARWMAIRAAPLARPDTVVVPVPIHRRRLLVRRYNQAAVLSRLMAKRLGCCHVPDALIRRRHTAPMQGDTFDSRAANIADSIRCNPRRIEQLSGNHVLLVDDVMTSGATFTSCSLQLRKNEVKEIHVVTLSRAVQFF